MTGWRERMDSVLVEDNIIAASTGCALGGTIHAGRVGLVPKLGAYSMSPLCVAYRKANGEELAKHANGGYPLLSRGFPYTFAQILAGEVAGARPCPHCTAVFLAREMGMPIVEYVRLAHSLKRAASPARPSGEDTPTHD